MWGYDDGMSEGWEFDVPGELYIAGLATEKRLSLFTSRKNWHTIILKSSFCSSLRSFKSGKSDRRNSLSASSSAFWGPSNVFSNSDWKAVHFCGFLLHGFGTELVSGAGVKGSVMSSWVSESAVDWLSKPSLSLSSSPWVVFSWKFPPVGLFSTSLWRTPGILNKHTSSSFSAQDHHFFPD